jgi:hypothetical protein
VYQFEPPELQEPVHSAASDANAILSIEIDHEMHHGTLTNANASSFQR